MVLICWAVQQHMVYRLYTVWLSASWAYAVLCVMAGLVPKTAVVLTQQVVHLTSCGTEDNFNADDFMGGTEEATSAAHAFLQAVITFRNCCVEQFGG